MPDSLSFSGEQAELIISADEVQAGIDKLAVQVQPVVDGGNCVLLGVLSGGMFPLVRLAESLQGDFLIDYCHASRYAGNTEGACLVWQRVPSMDLKGLDVVIVDDIYDEGITLMEVAEYCRQNDAASVNTAVLVIKDRERTAANPFPDFDAGLHVPDRYVFGCGMDKRNRWRHLTSIYALMDTGRS
ncbi:MAG: phosphoribosyltransferase family protein [Gammaproteobacteria bacterium]